MRPRTKALADTLRAGAGRLVHVFRTTTFKLTERDGYFYARPARKVESAKFKVEK